MMIKECILAGLNTGDESGFQKSMEELRGLAEAASFSVRETFTQNLPRMNAGLYFGTGKVGEIRSYLEMTGIDLVITEGQLTPMQLKNLSDALDAEVLDRTGLILQIFSDRARTREARMQVEYASLKYMLPRLAGMHRELGRQAGTSGSMSSRGSGEKKIELDRRHIEKRMGELRRGLEEVERERATQRRSRLRSGLPRAALVGYTNAGKSTVMNGMLTLYGNDNQKKVLEKDMLFATLDTSVRRISPGDNRRDFLLSDTVGFIDHLPPMLIRAFRSTLEETRYADLLLIVSDLSDPDFRDHLEVTLKTLEEIGAGDIPRVYVFNKADLAGTGLSSDISVSALRPDDRRITMSARNDSDLRRLVSLTSEALNAGSISCNLLIPYSDGQALSALMSASEVSFLDYAEDGIRISARLTQQDFGRYGKYLAVP